MFRGDLFTYSGGEDIELCVINYMSCRIETKLIPIKVSTSQYDSYRSIPIKTLSLTSDTYQNITYINRNNENQRMLYGEIYEYYINQGFLPSIYRSNKHTL